MTWPRSWTDWMRMSRFSPAGSRGMPCGARKQTAARAALEADREELRQRREDLARRRASLESRLSLLREQKARHEGFDLGVRHLLERRASLKGVVGVVGDLLSPARGTAEGVVESLLADAVQWIVVENEEAAMRRGGDPAPGRARRRHLLPPEGECRTGRRRDRTLAGESAIRGFGGDRAPDPLPPRQGSSRGQPRRSAPRRSRRRPPAPVPESRRGDLLVGGLDPHARRKRPGSRDRRADAGNPASRGIACEDRDRGAGSQGTRRQPRGGDPPPHGGPRRSRDRIDGGHRTASPLGEGPLGAEGRARASARRAGARRRRARVPGRDDPEAAGGPQENRGAARRVDKDPAAKRRSATRRRRGPRRARGGIAIAHSRISPAWGRKACGSRMPCARS